MTLPSSGTITLAQIATELGVSLPLDLNAANVRALAGKPSGNVVMPNDFWGKSSFAVDFSIGAEQDVTAGSPVSGNRRLYKLLTSSVSGGSGSYTYSWTSTPYDYSNFWLNQTTSSTAQISQGYNINEFDGPYYDEGTVTLTVTDTANGKVVSVSKTVGLG